MPELIEWLHELSYFSGFMNHSNSPPAIEQIDRDVACSAGVIPNIPVAGGVIDIHRTGSRQTMWSRIAHP